MIQRIEKAISIPVFLRGRVVAALTAAVLGVAPELPGAGMHNTYYVSPAGSDSNGCSQSTPCRTADYAFSIASPGDTVLVGAGTYDYGSHAAQFMKSGNAGSYITIECQIRGGCKIQNSVTGNRSVVDLGGSFITLDGFEITNTSSAGNNLGVYVTNSFVNITHNIIHHIESDCGWNGGGGIQIAGSGSQLGTAHDITVDSNLIYDINYTRTSGWRCNASTVQSDGILLETAGANIVVTNNIVHHTGGGWGILIASNWAVVANNLVFTTSNGGILDGLNAGYIVNNMVFNTGLVSRQCGVMLASSNNMTVANNDVFGNSDADFCLRWGSPIPDPGNGNLSVDPALGTTFVNWQADGSGDYHQKLHSPTIDAGSPVGKPPRADFDGNPRPRGAAYDIGAYEYQH